MLSIKSISKHIVLLAIVSIISYSFIGCDNRRTGSISELLDPTMIGEIKDGEDPTALVDDRVVIATGKVTVKFVFRPGIESKTPDGDDIIPLHKDENGMAIKDENGIPVFDEIVVEVKEYLGTERGRDFDGSITYHVYSADPIVNLTNPDHIFVKEER